MCDDLPAPRRVALALARARGAGSLKAMNSRRLSWATLALAACGNSSNGAPSPIDAGSVDANAVDAVSDAGTEGGDASHETLLPTGRFRIGMWCGPPAAELSKARFDEIAAAGFTTVSNACDGATYVPAYDSKLLALAQQAGLDAIVSDSRIDAALAGASVATNLDAVVQDYGKAPALAGYFVGDEPSAPAFANVASIVSQLASRDGAHFAYVNLLPDYASPGQLGTSTYDDYVAQFLGTVKPKVFSYDYYPFLAGGSDATTFFADLAVVRAHAVATNTPFWQFTQAISYNGHRATNEAEKLWVGMHTLAYGGAGISYFTYWTPPQTSENFGSAIIDANGVKTAQYAEVTAINQRLTAFGRYLVAAKSTSVFHNGALASGTVPRVPGAAVYVPSAAPLTVGLFDVGGDAYAFLVNRDYGAAHESDVYLAGGAGAPEVLDVATGIFEPIATIGADAKGTKVHVALAPADGTLIHLRGPLALGAPGAEAFVGVVRADVGALDVVDAAFGTARLRAAGWNDCPEGYVLAGRDFASDGFWLCARTDLASHTFYVGNVVADAGTMFAVRGGTATAQGSAGWSTCPKGALLGKRFESNGYWVCMD